MKKLPRDCTHKELEEFVTRHNHRLPECPRDTGRYGEELIAKTRGILIRQNKTFLEFRQTGLRKVLGSLFKKGSTSRSSSRSRTSSLSNSTILTDDVYQHPNLSDGSESELRESCVPLIQSQSQSSIDSLHHQVSELTNGVERFRFEQPPPPVPEKSQRVRIHEASQFPPPPEMCKTDWNHTEPEENSVFVPEQARAPPAGKRARQTQEMSFPSPNAGQAFNNLQSTPYGRDQTFQTDRNRTKFTVKFNQASMTIESYLAAVERWKIGNMASDKMAVHVALEGFQDVDLASYISDVMGSGVYQDFAQFVDVCRTCLGKNGRQWMDKFDSCRRKSSESAFVYLARLTSTLKKALEVLNLNEEHERIVLRKFMKTIHPKLRAQLELREPAVNYGNVAQIASKIEIALDLPKGPTVESVTNIETSGSKPGPAGYARKTNGGLFCQLCKRTNHTIENCFGNPLSERFSMESFAKLNAVPATNWSNVTKN